MRSTLVVVLVAIACSREPNISPDPARSEPTDLPQPAPEGAAWLLSGTNEERFATVAKHLRGFDVAMVETAYRYGELAERFHALTATCNACHQAERVPFIHVRPPPVRTSPVGIVPMQEQERDP